MEQGITQFTPTMIAAWTLVAVAFCALGVVLYVALRNRRRDRDLEQKIQVFRDLDIEAFRNLIDPAEELFLRENLSPQKFRKIKRQRAWVALIYSWEVGKAASGLAVVGQVAQQSSDPSFAASGAQLAENAYRLRLQSITLSFRLVSEILLPGIHATALPAMVEEYDRTAGTLFRLGRFSSGSRPLADSKMA